MKKTNKKLYDVIIIGGSYAGLSAAMSLGRSLRSVLVIDNGSPCNKQTPHSHNFITQDGVKPAKIASITKSQVQKYDTVRFLDGLVISCEVQEAEFSVELDSGENFVCKKVLLATGVRDILPKIAGFAECWGVSVLHCPYCHGYEVKDEDIVILGNGLLGFSLAKLIQHWSKNVSVLTNGVSSLNIEQKNKLKKNNITII